MGAIFVVADQHDAATQKRVADGLETGCEAADSEVGNTQTSSTEEARIIS